MQRFEGCHVWGWKAVVGLLKYINDETLVYREENRGQISRVALGIMKGRYIDISIYII